VERNRKAGQNPLRVVAPNEEEEAEGEEEEEDGEEEEEEEEEDFCTENINTRNILKVTLQNINRIFVLIYLPFAFCVFYVRL
jgi:hypothetical protein